jgi:hypothetical protein
MLKNKTRRSSATSPDRQAKVARTTTSRATVIPAKPATKKKSTTTSTAAKVFIIPLTHTVSPITPTNTGNYPYTATKIQYKTFIEDLNKIFTNEKIIDRDDKAGFKELIAEQRPYNKLLYKITPKNIVCFIVCDYYGESQVFNKYNNHNGNAEFNELLHKNNMGMIWLNHNTLYIYKYM